jgi:hypothetical protein
MAAWSVGSSTNQTVSIGWVSGDFVHYGGHGDLGGASPQPLENKAPHKNAKGVDRELFTPDEEIPDTYGRPTTVIDGKGTQTLHYDKGSGVLTSMDVSGLRTFTTTYDADGDRLIGPTNDAWGRIISLPAELPKGKRVGSRRSRTS